MRFWDRAYGGNVHDNTVAVHRVRDCGYVVHMKEIFDQDSNEMYIITNVIDSDGRKFATQCSDHHDADVLCNTQTAFLKNVAETLESWPTYTKEELQND